jgi:hypothetical protein
MAHDLAKLEIIFFGEVFADCLVVGVSQKAIKPPAVNIIGVARLFGNVVVDMMGDDVSLLRDDFNDQISQEKGDPRIFKFKGSVGTVTVQPKRAMAPHKDHAVEKTDCHEGPAKIMLQKNPKRNGKREASTPAHHSEPVFPGFKYIQSGQKFPKNFSIGGCVELTVSLKAIMRGV